MNFVSEKDLLKKREENPEAEGFFYNTFHK